MILKGEKKTKVANELCDFMIKNDVENFVVKREIYAMHAQQHGVDSKEARTMHVSFDLVMKNKEDMP